MSWAGISGREGESEEVVGSPVPFSLLGSLAFYWTQRREVAVLAACSCVGSLVTSERVVPGYLKESVIPSHM